MPSGALAGFLQQCHGTYAGAAWAWRSPEVKTALTILPSRVWPAEQITPYMPCPPPPRAVVRAMERLVGSFRSGVTQWLKAVKASPAIGLHSGKTASRTP